MDIKDIKVDPNLSAKKAAEELFESMASPFSDHERDIELTRFVAPVIPQPLKQEDINNYQSAAVFMNALAERALQWKENIPDDHATAIVAILYGGVQIHVNSLSKVSFHGIQIEGELNGNPCSMLAHQSTVQMLCFAEKITEESPRKEIGFIWDGREVTV